MKSLDVEGLFWLTTEPQNEVAGRLTFDATNGAQLSLIGAFHELSEFGDLPAEPVRIQGVAGKKSLTLDECLRTRRTIEHPGIAREMYYAPIVLAGAHFDEGEPLKFIAATLRLRHLEKWVGVSGVNVEDDWHEQSNGIRQIRITCTPVEKLAVPTSLGDLELSFRYKLHSDRFVQTVLEENCELGLKFLEPQSLEETLKACVALQHLVTIGVGAPAPISSVSLSHADLVHTSPQGETVHHPIELYAELRGGDVPGHARTLHPEQMIFAFDDIGGLEGVAQWLEVSDRYQAVINSLMSHWYIPKVSVDNRFFNVVTAAEALARIRRKKQRIDFGDELRVLAHEAGSTFGALVGDVNSWVKEIVQVRNNNVVHRGLRGDVQGSRLYWLAESVYFLVVLVLCSECDVPEATSAKIRNHQRFASLASRLKGA